MKEARRRTDSRRREIIQVSVVGILVNLFLGGLKAALGLASGSLALISDALNNITDSSSSLITIIGTKLAGKEPDRQHPFGHGRTEYLTGFLIGGIVFFTGAQALIGVVRSFWEGSRRESYTPVTMVIIAATIISKIVLGVYTQNAGKKYQSSALEASGADAKNDALVTLLTLLSVGIFYFTGFSVDKIAGTILSLFIMKTGAEVLRETVKKILGERVDGGLVRDIKALVRQGEGVVNCFDLVLNDYGPDYYTGSMNVEIEDNRSIGEMYPILHELQTQIYEKFRVYLVFGFYAVNVADPRYQKIVAVLKKYKEQESHLINYHGIVIDEKNTTIYCDLTRDFDITGEALTEEAEKRLSQVFPDYTIHINIDTEFTGE